MSKSIQKLKYFLKEMFQFNENDLDFGIYKIYNLKRKHIESFIDGDSAKDLQPTIEAIIKEVNLQNQKKDSIELYNFLKGKNMEGLLEEPDANYDDIQLALNFEKDDEKKESLKQTLDNLTKSEGITDELKDKIYNHILGFFQMYYSNGDFGYNDRSRDLYKVPYEADYNGSDTMFHWKHKGSLYIKTGTSFNAIKFKLNGKTIEYRLESNIHSEDEGTSQNNNKDSQLKHYRLDRIEKTLDKVTNEEIYQVVFNLSDSSTSKVDIFNQIFEEVFERTDIDKYLEYTKNDKTKQVFVDLTKDFDKVQNGQFKSLRQKKTKVEKEVKNNFERGVRLYDEETREFTDETLKDLYTLDQKLNSFYIGHDADYFIHENLNEFLTNEKNRYVKNYIFDDLESIYSGKLDNTTLLIAKAFDKVSSRIIEFLSAIEDFQKHLFTKKKKVVENEYCITVDYIDEKYYPEILANKTQLQEWENLFSLEVKTIEDIKDNPTLVLDTKCFKQADGTNPFKDKILSEIDDIDEKTNGLLINSENYQALELLENKFNERIDSIYTDPPYNTGNDSFKYQDNFKHSSWACMIFQTLNKLPNYLRDKSGIAISINEEESYHLKLLLDMIFSEYNYLANAVIKVRHENRILKGDKDFHECIENLLIYRNTLKFKPGKRVVDNSDLSAYKYSIVENNSHSQLHVFGNKKVYEFHPDDFEIVEHEDGTNELLQQINIRGGLREGNSSGRFYVAHLEKFFPVKRGHLFKVMNMGADGLGYRYFLIPPSDSSRVNSDYFQGVPVNRKDTKELPYPNLLDFTESKYYDFERVFNKVGNEGGVSFRNGKKPIKFIEHVFKMLNLTKLQTGYVLDPFGGSASTFHSILNINNSYNKSFKSILFEMGSYFNTVTLPRSKKSVFANKWTKDSYSEHIFKKHIFKYQVLEQYEDVLDNLQVYDSPLPDNLPIKYLYKPEENTLDNTLNLFAPFNNRINYGQPTQQGFIDVVETYNYLQGYFIKSIKTYELNKKYYKVVETTNGVLVIWRDITINEDDSDNVIAIASKYDNIHTIEVNAEFATLVLDKNNHLKINDEEVELRIISKDIFNQ